MSRDHRSAVAVSPARRWPPRALANSGVLIGLGLLAIVSVLVMGFATNTMARHGATTPQFEYAGTPAKVERILAGYGAAGRRAAWWQLGLDLPFMLSYALLLAAACWYAARQLAAVGLSWLAAIALAATSLGPLAAASDLTQNVALAFELRGHTGQPAPRIAELFGYLTFFFAIAAGAVFVCGSLIAAAKRRNVPQQALEQP